MLVKINPNSVVIFIQNIVFFTTSWPAKAVQNRSIRFCEGEQRWNATHALLVIIFPAQALITSLISLV